VEVLDTIKSNDGATKTVVKFRDGLVGEVTYINYPNKDIVCCPTQTSCKMGCKFCFLTTNGQGTKLRNLSSDEMVELVSIAHREIEYRRPLLVSFMGAGEPLNNWASTLDACYRLRNQEGEENVRFAFATMIPKGRESVFMCLASEVKENKLNLKAHLSLHFTTDEKRREYMPAACDIKSAISLLETYKNVTGNPVEVHYTLMHGVNDRWSDSTSLGLLLRGRDIPVKLLHYSENPALDAQNSYSQRLFAKDLLEFGVGSEYYKPNGLDIGASCGQFQLERYVR
jgi:23S rRNA (adenine2503-C2)-methyltransferase